MNSKKEYGDFQTPDSLATKAVNLVAELFGTPDIVVEPTAGLGAFLKSSVQRWGNLPTYEGYEVNGAYVETARTTLGQYGINILHRDFFAEDWGVNLARHGKRRVLVIGNPPWVTNSALGQLRSSNLPAKSNFQGLRGFDARTGKSNFDIAEWILIRLIEALPPEGAVAMLCKTMTARKVLRHFWKNGRGWDDSKLFHIDARAEFDAATDACLFYTSGKRTDTRMATMYPTLDIHAPATRFGFIDGDLVSDIDAYEFHRDLDGGTESYTWRSGVKHDAAKVMEFTRHGDGLINGFGEVVDIEDDYVFPLLKSSDLGNGRLAARKAVLVTQRRTGDDTLNIKENAPKTWSYLTRHADTLDGRRSSIYANRPRFSVFGIGPYSFAPWKIAISGLYKNISFLAVPPHNERPVMVDDTCYSLPCHSKEEAELLFELLSSNAAQEFLKSLVFLDSKRPITVDVLRRLSIVELARKHEKLDELKRFIDSRSVNAGTQVQMPLLMEAAQEYRATRHGKELPRAADL